MKHSSRRLVCLLGFALWTTVCLPGSQARPPDDGTRQPHSQQQSAALIPKHDGSKNDLEAIGNRKLGKKGIGNWYSIEQEAEMGKRYAEAVEETSILLNDPLITEYVNRIGQNLVRNSDAVVPFVIKVIDSDEVNAFALPGGFLYVNTGMILAANDEAELAGVMAHETAHVAAHHAVRQMTRGRLLNLASIPLIFVGGGVGYAIQSALMVGKPLAATSFSRGFELEADYLGLQYLYKAGYDPQAFISFFERMQKTEKQKPGTLAKAFANHPQTRTRIKKGQQEIATILPDREQYIVTTSEFESVKARLQQIENRGKVTGSAKINEPSLRRTGGDKRNGTGGDEVPILRKHNPK